MSAIIPLEAMPPESSFGLEADRTYPSTFDADLIPHPVAQDTSQDQETYPDDYDPMETPDLSAGNAILHPPMPLSDKGLALAYISRKIAENSVQRRIAADDWRKEDALRDENQNLLGAKAAIEKDLETGEVTYYTGLELQYQAEQTQARERERFTELGSVAVKPEVTVYEPTDERVTEDYNQVA